MDIILFVLPAHTSNILQLLDVAVFGPFKNYYYSACSTCMAENIGQIITRYDICQIACKAYTRAMSPANIQSSFRKTAIFPHNPSVSYMHQMVPCESFRVENPVQRVTLLNTGRAEAEGLSMHELVLLQNRNITILKTSSFINAYSNNKDFTKKVQINNYIITTSFKPSLIKPNKF